MATLIIFKNQSHGRMSIQNDRMVLKEKKKQPCSSSNGFSVTRD